MTYITPYRISTESIANIKTPSCTLVPLPPRTKLRLTLPAKLPSVAPLVSQLSSSLLQLPSTLAQRRSLAVKLLVKLPLPVQLAASSSRETHAGSPTCVFGTHHDFFAVKRGFFLRSDGATARALDFFGSSTVPSVLIPSSSTSSLIFSALATPRFDSLASPFDFSSVESSSDFAVHGSSELYDASHLVFALYHVLSAALLFACLGTFAREFVRIASSSDSSASSSAYGFDASSLLCCESSAQLVPFFEHFGPSCVFMSSSSSPLSTVLRFSLITSTSFCAFYELCATSSDLLTIYSYPLDFSVVLRLIGSSLFAVSSVTFASSVDSSVALPHACSSQPVSDEFSSVFLCGSDAPISFDTDFSSGGFEYRTLSSTSCKSVDVLVFTCFSPSFTSLDSSTVCMRNLSTSVLSPTLYFLVSLVVSEAQISTFNLDIHK
ncbi:hypothetical protein K435DRAFT_854427 [Dendrothele bispora CBS 962.96]|uniref:Uncharacterized protein n=1 Tax=Dendrothele bispora (strain CBS 962.96) TaxID=1314807 RepID=A0A4S8MDV1_DENBC|nr:hypothetical protein K435DRAFT_854427 [Dendrothele bispora CBS 962.96]